jgi:hypothetical protein
MVLEESSQFSDPPPSDDDPYVGDRDPTILSSRDPSSIRITTGASHVYVNLSNLPRPLIIASTIEEHRKALAKVVEKSCQQAAQILGRPVKQEEADALAFHSAKAVRIASYGTPIGMVLATGMAYKGMSKFRFPGYTPGEKFNPDKFPPISGLVTGRRARLLWHFFRFNFYWLAGGVVGSLFFGSYALTVGTAGRAMDPRLKEVMESLKDNNKRTGLPGNRQVDTTAGPRPGESMEMARQRQNVQQQQQQPMVSNVARQGDDDMSPAGGTFESGFFGGGSDAGMLNDDQARREREKSERQKIAERRRGDSDGPTPAAAGKPGSAWERVRQQAASGSNAKPTGPDSTSSFDEEEKQSARVEAQKEFDDRIERERAGRDFEENKRW